MPITFNSIQDPYGLRSAGSSLAQALMQRNLEERQDKRDIAREERAFGRQQEQRQLQAGALQEAMAIVANPNSTSQEKIAALQQYATATGDSKTASPILNNILKQDARQGESESALNFLRQMGIDVPENLPPGSVPPASFLSNFAQGLKPTFEPESDKIEAKRTAEVADKVIREYEGAITSKDRLNRQLLAAKSGKLTTPMMYKLGESLGIPLSVFANPLSETYEKDVNEYIKGISNYFPGAIRLPEIEAYMKTIPTLENSDAGKELIINNLLLEKEAQIANYEAYKQILKENGGRKPKNLDVELLERTKSKRDELAEKYLANIQKAIQITEHPREKVKQGTPITPAISLRYLKASKGNRAEAEKMAREDGYDF